MIVQGTLTKLLFPGLNEVFNRTVTEIPQLWQTFFNTEALTENRVRAEDFSWAGLEPPREFREAEPIPMSEINPGFTTTYVPVKYGNGYRITKEMVDDILYSGVLESLPASLVRGARHLKESLAAAVFNQGFVRNGGDGVPLFSTAHPLIGNPGVVANRFSTATPLSHTAIKEALTAMAKNLDDVGIPNPVPARYLVVPRDLEFDAKEIIGTERVPYSGDNTINALPPLEVVVWDYLDNNGDTSNWFLTAEKSQTKLKYFERYPLTQVAEDIDFNMTMKYGIYEKYVFGASDYIGTFGVLGA